MMPEAARQQVEHAEFPMLDVRAAPVASSFDEENRTVEFIASTGARGLRQSWRGDYYEELEISESAIRMERLNNAAPFLNAHNAWGVNNVLGVVERGWIENGNLIIRVKFSQRDEVAPILQDIRDGVLPHVSVGYYVQQYDVTEREGELDVRRGVDWEPVEVSLVPIGFDDGATVRSERRETRQAIINRSTGPSQEGHTMSDEAQQDQAPVATDAPDSVETRQAEGTDSAAPEASAAPEQETRSEQDPRAVADAAVRNERQRVTEIRRAVRAARLNDDFADSLINDGVSVDNARARIIDEWASQDTSEEISTVRAGTDHQVVDNMRQGVTDALLHRAGAAEDIGTGAEFGGMTLLRLCEDLLQRQGVRVRGMDRMEIATRALSTSDLANITGAVTNRTLLMGYESAPRTFVGVFRQGTAQDFRDINRVRLSGAPALLEVKEGGEFKHGQVTDEKETYSLATYGRILGFTREAIINDDMDALSRLPMMFGRAAADLESDIVWGIMPTNATLQDGVALFASGHGNLAGSGGAISTATVGAARAAMRKQTGMEGRLINVQPRHIIVGADKETELDQFLTTITPDQQGNAIPTSMRSLNPVVEPRLEGNAWYMAADFAQVDTIEYSYLAGNAGVYIETRDGFTRDGIEMKARHDFAAKAIDYRGLYRNPGA